MNKNDIQQLLEDAMVETGVSFKNGVAATAAYAAESVARLVPAASEPGFELAVRAERDAVLLFGGLETVDEADAVDNRIRGIVQGILFAGAKLATGGVA